MEYIEKYKYVKTKLVIILFLIVLFIYTPIFSNWIYDFLLKTNILTLFIIHTVKNNRLINWLFLLFVSGLISLLLFQYIPVSFFYLLLWWVSLLILWIAFFINITEYSYWYFNEKDLENNEEKENLSNTTIYENNTEFIENTTIEKNLTENKEKIEKENFDSYYEDNSAEEDDNNTQLLSNMINKQNESNQNNIDLFSDDDIEDIEDPFSINNDDLDPDKWEISWNFNPKNCIWTWDEFSLTEEYYNQIINM